MPEPLRTRPTSREKQDLTAPEALLISALLESGQFIPEQHHVKETDPVAWRKLWDFCVNYQTKTGAAPPIGLVKLSFPEFDITPGVSPAWAAEQLRIQASFRDLRLRSAQMLAAINDEDVEGAFGAMSDLEAPRGYRKAPSSVFEHDVLAERFNVNRIEVPYPTLQRATKGGIEAGELWLLAMRLGQGKTYVALNFAARAASIGWNVGVISCEMPARQVVRRSLRHLAGRDVALLNRLDAEEEAVWKAAQDEIALRTPGKIEVVDPSHGRINTVQTVRDMCRDYDLVIADHLGLFQGPDGRRAVDDWHVMANVSNSLREVTLATNTAVLGVVQVNRAGEHAGTKALPRPSELSQSDALGQDATVVITGKRLSARVLKLGAPKVREGEAVTWHTNFDPGKNRFDEITADRALELEIMDEEQGGFD